MVPLLRVRHIRCLLVLCLVATGALCSGGESLVQPGAEVEKVAGGFKFTEGPAPDDEGNIFFSDIPNQRIHKCSKDGKVTVFRENSGGSNGLIFDEDGDLVACEGDARRVTATSPDGDVTVLADSFDGKKLNSPNDVWIDDDGGIYFTDPRYGRTDDLEQDGMHVYYLPPGKKKLIRVADDLSRPNGIVGTPDGKTLYVADERGRKTWRYTIRPDGTLSDKKLFTRRGSDGMTLDEKGNLYMTLGGVTVFSPKGKKLKTIKVPENTTNVCFGGEDGKTLFITAQKSLYALKMNVCGVE